MIDLTSLMLKESIDARPGKIVAGLEPDNTNLLLQAIYRAAVSLENSDPYVKRVLEAYNEDGEKSVQQSEKAEEPPAKKEEPKKQPPVQEQPPKEDPKPAKKEPKKQAPVEEEEIKKPPPQEKVKEVKKEPVILGVGGGAHAHIIVNRRFTNVRPSSLYRGYPVFRLRAF